MDKFSKNKFLTYFRNFCVQIILLQVVFQVIVKFFQKTSIHGFVHLVQTGLHIIEKLMWILCICVAIFSTVSLGQRTWQRFLTSPTVISMDRNKFFWNTSFPSLTVCPHKRINETKLQEFISENPEKFHDNQEADDFGVFIKKLANISFENFDELPMNNTFGISSSEYLDLLWKLRFAFQWGISSGTSYKLTIVETITEFGFCYSVNSCVANYNTYNYWRNNSWETLAQNDRAVVHPLDGEIYAQIMNLSTAYDVYFHGAMEIPDISKQRYTFAATDYTTIDLLALEILTTEEAKQLSVWQRQCRFTYESDEMFNTPVYSYFLCRNECRMKVSLRMCNCIPHFYRSRTKHGENLPICGFEGFKCLAKIKEDIISLKSNNFDIKCNCLANCDDSNFFVQTYNSRIWFLGSNLQWGINDYPKMQVKRDVIFSFTDLLVYIGGIAGFFLGCSLLSFTEILYFFVWTFIKIMSKRTLRIHN